MLTARPTLENCRRGRVIPPGQQSIHLVVLELESMRQPLCEGNSTISEGHRLNSIRHPRWPRSSRDLVSKSRYRRHPLVADDDIDASIPKVQEQFLEQPLARNPR